MSVVNIETRRLIGRAISESGFDDFRRIHSDPRAMATLAADRQPVSEERTRTFVRDAVVHWQKHGFGYWLFHDRASGEFVGYCGVWNSAVEGNPEIELAYAVVADSWSRGFGTEMADAVVRVAFGPLRLKHLVALTLPTNIGSRSVMEKSGFRFERDIVHAGLPHVLYRLSADQFAVRERG